MLTFQLDFVSEVYLISLNGNIYVFSVDYNSIKTSDISSVQKYLMTKNNLKI